MTVIVNEVELIPEPEPRAVAPRPNAPPPRPTRPADVMAVVRLERRRRLRTWAH